MLLIPLLVVVLSWMEAQAAPLCERGPTLIQADKDYCDAKRAAVRHG